MITIITLNIIKFNMNNPSLNIIINVYITLSIVLVHSKGQ